MTKRPRDGRSDDADPEPSRKRTAKGTPAPDELDLWRYTMRAVKPLRKAKPRVPEVGAAAEPQPKPRPVAVVKRPPLPTPAPSPVKPAATKTLKPTPPQSPPPLVPIERRKARKIARGHVEIDDRIDLHGLRQVDAERRLRAFLLSARAHGLRTVLVITGKGSARGKDDHDHLERSAPGVLKRSVPLWLEQPELRDCVAGVAPAHIRHGGDGALYIHIRKPRGRG